MKLNFKYKKPIPENSSTKEEFIRWRFEEIKPYDDVIDNLSNIVYESQVKYSPGLTLDYCKKAVLSVLDKREFQHTICTAINLDVLCENNMLLGPLQAAVFEDRGTFGVDETLIGVAQIYGSIGISNAYSLDKSKPGIIGEVDQIGKETEYCHTFLDDMFCAIACSAMGKIAHDFDQGNKVEANE